MRPAPTLFTVGHGTRTLEELVEVLRDAGVEVLADVRRYPGSQRHPHFSREELERSLPEHGIAYEWWGDVLGGRRRPADDSPNLAWRDPSFRAYADHMDSDEFRGALDELLRRADSERVGVMCAETVWWRCHRRLIADAATARGVRVVHLGVGREPGVHALHDQARVIDGDRLVYDVGVDRPLGADVE